MAKSFELGKIANKSSSLKVGAGLLNEASKSAITKQTKTVYINYQEIEENPRNKMTMNDIDILANQIETSGLEQPIVVYQLSNGKYRILTGHRRFRAINQLIQQKKWPSDGLIECKVKNIDEIDLPLNFEEKEMLEILVTNQYREKTEADTLFEYREWKTLIAKLRSNGVEYMVVGTDSNGEPINQQIKGTKTRDLIADNIGIGRTKVAQIEKIEKEGSKELIEALEQNQININVAAQVTDLPETEQVTLIQKTLSTNTKISSEDLKKHLMESDTKELSHNPDLITSEIFKQDTKTIEKAQKRKNVSLTPEEHKEYLRLIQELQVILKIN